MLRLPSLFAVLPLSWFALVAGCSNLATVSIDAPRPVGLVAFAPGASLSEDEEVAEVLQESLSAFLGALRRGEWSAGHTDASERERFGFFYQSLLRGAREAEPLVLKSYPIGEGAHMITVAFVKGVPEAMAITRIVELEAVPAQGGYRFRCPFERNTVQFQKRTIGDVTFRFSGSFDEERSTAFAQFKARWDSLLEVDPQPLQYDCFQSLEELLQAFGLVHDASKCNFLQHDLGFVWDAGQRFATGTGDERYLFGYLPGAIAASAPDAESIYRPYVIGAAAYYGGYGLSGDSMEVLARQFREERERRPNIDFLEEFEKGRGSSIQRHFSYFVMCAFLYGEIVAQHGEAAALRLVHSGAQGEQFFQMLEASIGVTKHNFHDTIVELIGGDAG